MLAPDFKVPLRLGEVIELAALVGHLVLSLLRSSPRQEVPTERWRRGATHDDAGTDGIRAGVEDHAVVRFHKEGEDEGGEDAPSSGCPCRIGRFGRGVGTSNTYCEDDGRDDERCRPRHRWRVPAS